MITLFAGPVVHAQVSDSTGIRVKGEVAHPMIFHGEDLAKMKRISVSGKDRDGKEHSYSGVAVADIIRSAKE